MKSRFLIFTLFLAVMCIGSAGNAMAQSVTGTGVFSPGGGGPPATITVSAQQGGNGGVMRLGQPGQAQEGTLHGEIIAHPVDICVNSFANPFPNPVGGPTAFVVAEITQASGDFAGTEGQFLVFGFLDNGGSGDALLFFGFFVIPFQIPACDLVGAPNLPIPVDRGGFQVKP